MGILEGLAPGRRGVSEASEQTERASCSSDASEASLPRRLLALLPVRLPARLVGPLAVDAPRFGSARKTERRKEKRVQKCKKFANYILDLSKAEDSFLINHNFFAGFMDANVGRLA